MPHQMPGNAQSKMNTETELGVRSNLVNRMQGKKIDQTCFRQEEKQDIEN